MKKLIYILVSLIFVSNSVFADDFLILLDTSVSMMDSIDDIPKYQIAVNEAKKALSTLPATTNVGLRTIGLDLNADIMSLMSNPMAMCKATRLTVPIETNNREMISQKLDEVFPLGTTPLTYSLQQAIDSDFKNNNAIKHIILITDGGENCNQDPCKYITELMTTRRDIKIDIIAINVNGTDFTQLKCLADKTHGNIIKITKPNEISKTLTKFFNNSSPPNISPDIQSQQNDYKIIYKNYVFQF